MTESERQNPFNESLDALSESSTPAVHGDGAMGLSNAEQLSLAIQEAKSAVLACPLTSADRRRQLVGRLVQLRLQLSQLSDEIDIGGGDVADAEKHTNVCNHQFVVQDMRGRNPYCEYCLGIVWRLIQPWYRCKECGYRAHGKCLSLVTRVCAAELCRTSSSSTPPTYSSMEMTPAKGLAAQSYRCAECRASLAFHCEPSKDGTTSSTPRLCDYSGKYYCSACHWNDQLVIPARVVHNWDFTQHPVARCSKQYLEIMQRRPLIKLEASNAVLFNFVQELRVLKEMRRDILLMKVYFMACRKLKRHQYFVENADAYSLLDLVELNDGTLETEVRAVLRTFLEHIAACETCAGNGFVCELCADNRIIFPFNDKVHTCKLCLAVFHAYVRLRSTIIQTFRQCMAGVSNECPRCARRLQRDAQHAHSDDAEEDVQVHVDASIEEKLVELSGEPANPFDEDIQADHLNPFLEVEKTELNPFH